MLPLLISLSLAAQEPSNPDTESRVTAPLEQVTVTATRHFLLVEKGQYVRKGQAIALVGSSGEADEPGLFYGISEGGRFFDPLRYRFWL